MNSFRETIQFYLVDSKTPLGKLIDVFIIILNFVICAILVVETYDVSEAVHRLLWNTEVIIVAFFIIEYAARLYGSRDRLKQLTVLMIISGIILIPWQANRLVREWIHIASKQDITCPQCGLRYHDKDASHCKSCGHFIYQEYEDG